MRTRLAGEQYLGHCDMGDRVALLSVRQAIIVGEDGRELLVVRFQQIASVEVRRVPDAAAAGAGSGSGVRVRVRIRGFCRSPPPPGRVGMVLGGPHLSERAPQQRQRDRGGDRAGEGALRTSWRHSCAWASRSSARWTERAQGGGGGEREKERKREGGAGPGREGRTISKNLF